MAKTPAQILWEAADKIEDLGLMKENLWGPHGEMCSRGALMSVVGTWNTQTSDAEAALASHLRIPDVVNWNNAPERTKAEVVAGFRSAALSLNPSLANIGRDIEEVEVTPISVPVTEPVAPEPVKEPDRELQPA